MLAFRDTAALLDVQVITNRLGNLSLVHNGYQFRENIADTTDVTRYALLAIVESH